jgi:VCBS repeat protein/FG-GAP repeat protein
MSYDLACRGRLSARASLIAAALALLPACGHPASARTGAEVRQAPSGGAAGAAAEQKPKQKPAAKPEGNKPEGNKKGDKGKADQGKADQGQVEVIPVQPADANRDVVPFEGPIPLEPPDGHWLKDEYGRPYFIHRIAKVEGAYVWVVEGKRVQLPRGLTLDVVGQDDKTFSVKIYGTPPEWVQENKPAGPPSPEDLARVAASYKPEAADVDRLQLAAIGQGLPSQGQWRHGFAVADVNKDGHLDIVHGPPRKGGSRPVIFLGDGKGGWRRWAEATFPALPFDYGDAAVADFNGDGNPDIALACHLRGIAVMVGDGRGHFRLWSQGIGFQAADSDVPVFSSRAIVAVDWNRDGKPDLVALGEGPRLAVARTKDSASDFSGGARGLLVYLNQGDGTWRKEAPAERKDVGFGDALVVADFNGDGRLDVATASAVMGNRSLLHLAKADGTWEERPLDALRPQAIFRALASGDFNRDGRPDLAVGYTSNEMGVVRTGVDVLLARRGGTWERRALANEEKNVGIWSLDAGDLNGDGALDLVGLDGEGLPWVFLGDGKGSFAREQSPEMKPPDTGCAGYHVALADVDGDGEAEVLAGFAGEGSSSPLGVPRCTTGGGLKAWKVERRQAGR